MDNIESSIGKKIGPLAAWQWGVIGAGGFLLLRYVKGQQTGNGTQTVTLQPNASGGVGNPATSTGSIGSLLQQLGAEYPIMSFTLPDGTYFSGQNGIFVTPKPPPGGGSGGGSGGSGGGGGGGTGGYTGILPPYYLRRPDGPLDPRTPNPLPSVRPGNVIPGAHPNPLPGGNGYDPIAAWWANFHPTNPPPTTGGGGPLPVRPGGPPSGHTPGVLPTGR